MWSNPSALVLVAGGNSGEAGLGSIGSPATNKNGVAVGASLNSESSWESFGVDKGTDYFNEQSLAYFSSRGPTSDGRVKPDVCGVGKSLVSYFLCLYICYSIMAMYVLGYLSEALLAI